MPFPTCVILPNLVFLGQTVRASWRRSTWKISPLASRLSGPLKVIGTNMDRSAIYDFLLAFHSNYGPISFHFRDNWRFQSKITDFFQPHVYLTPRLSWFPLELGNAGGLKKLQWWGYQVKKKVGRYFSRLGTIHECDGRTREIDTGRQQVLRLRIASRAKNQVYFSDMVH